MVAQLKQLHYRHVKALGALWLCLMMAGCGYQLQDADALQLPFKAVALECNYKRNWHLCQDLNNRLSLRGVTISKDAPLVLEVSTIAPRQRILTIAGDASTEEYELTLGLKYALRKKQNQQESAALFTRNRLHLSRIYRHQSDALLAKEREREKLTRSMYQQLANTMLWELSEAPVMPTKMSE